MIVPADATQAGPNELTIEFIAGDEALNRNDEFLYTLFVPARAHLAFPCFDQPDLKARYALALDVPAELAGGCQRRRIRTGASDGRREARVQFAETQPLPTYLFAFVAGKFTLETATRHGRELRMFHRETDAAKVARNRDAIFDLHATALAVARGLHGHPVRLRQVRLRADPVVPVQRHGARRRDSLQRVGAAARRVGDAEPAARPRKRDRSRDRAHVVRRSGDDALVQRRLDEGGVRQLHGGEDREPVVSAGESRAPFSARRTTRRRTRWIARQGTNPIRQPLANLDEAGQLYGPIIYQKAPIVMRQLEMMIGEAGLRDGLREYLKRLRVRQRHLARARSAARCAHAA